MSHNNFKDAKVAGYSNYWGGLELNLNQFWTFYNHTNENKFLGFASYHNEEKFVKKEKNIAVLYGKIKKYFDGKIDFVRYLAKFFELHTTIKGIG